MQIGVSYFGNRILKHVKYDMQELKQNGFTFVLHTYSEFDLMFNSGTMKEIFKITHDAGLDVWVNPWGIGNVFGGEPFSNFATKNIFTSCQILDDGKPTPIACPNSPDFNKFMDSWVEMIIDSNVMQFYGMNHIFMNKDFYQAFQADGVACVKIVNPNLKMILIIHFRKQKQKMLNYSKKTAYFSLFRVYLKKQKMVELETRFI